MRDVHVRRHRKIVPTISKEGLPGWRGLPPMGKRFTRTDAQPILRELKSLEGRGAFVRAEIVGSVAEYGFSEHDLDILIMIDPSRIGMRFADLDAFYEWLYSPNDEAVDLTEAIQAAMGRANAFPLYTTEPDPQPWVLVRGDRSIPVDLWIGWQDRETQYG